MTKQKTDKTEKLIEDLKEQIEESVVAIAAQGKLDHFEMFVKNHNGMLQVDTVTKNRVKSY